MRKLNWKIFIEKRKPVLKISYIIAGVFLFLIGLTGFQYGAALMYWPLALICFSMVFYPNLLAWLIILLIFISGIIMYAHLLISKIIQHVNGQTPWDYSEIIMFIPVLILILTGITFFVFKTKPKKI